MPRKRKAGHPTPKVVALNKEDLSHVWDAVHGAMTHLAVAKAALQSTSLQTILPDQRVTMIVHNMVNTSGIANTPDAGTAHYELMFMYHKNIILVNIYNGALATRILDEIGTQVDLSSETPVVRQTIAAPRPGLEQIIS
jgi:hypothetical protein